MRWCHLCAQLQTCKTLCWPIVLFRYITTRKTEVVWSGRPGYWTDTHGFHKFCRAKCLHCTDTSPKDIQGRSWQAVKFCVKKKNCLDSQKRESLKKLEPLTFYCPPHLQLWPHKNEQYKSLIIKCCSSSTILRNMLGGCDTALHLHFYQITNFMPGTRPLVFKLLNFYSIISYTASMFYP